MFISKNINEYKELSKKNIHYISSNENNKIKFTDNFTPNNFLNLKEENMNMKDENLCLKNENINLKEENIINNNDIIKIFDNSIKICKNKDLFENDFINFEDIYFIDKYQLKNEKENLSPAPDIKKNNIEEKLLSKKRQKKIKYKRTKEHSKFEKDNIMRKLNIHYISFIVKYVNFNIKQLISKKQPVFANLSYNFKKNINSSYFNKLKDMSLGEVLQNEGSNKNKRNMSFPKDNNVKIFNSVYPKLKDLLDINYIEFFRKVYSKSRINSDDVNNIYKAPKKISYFDDFIIKEIQKDKINGKLYAERVKYFSKKEFIHKGFPFFKIKTK